MTWDEIQPLLRTATLETLQMTVWSAALSALGGLLLGVLLVLTERGGLLPAPPLNKVLGAVVNVGRSLPFIILMVAILPFTRAIVGTTIGTDAAIVPLTVAAIPFYARLVETSLREARPGLVAGLTVTVIALIGYSAMAGTIGGGGLGDLADRYGYQRFETGVMVSTVVLLIVIVQLVQMLGDFVARRLSHR
ncbi:MAG TPA: methionine ABC transporter permease [Thermomonospora sp.]|nr:methionine ABC transporter permease [Thermomonospora sp.]